MAGTVTEPVVTIAVLPAVAAGSWPRWRRQELDQEPGIGLG